MPTSLDIDTPAGAVRVAVSAAAGVRIEQTPAAALALPAGMRIDGVALIRVRFLDAVDRRAPATLRVEAAADGAPETGEGLEGMTFPSPEGTLQIGVRDPDWLEARGTSAEWPTYGARSLSQRINTAPAGSSLYVSVVWRLATAGSSSDDASTWYAAELALPR